MSEKPLTIVAPAYDYDAKDIVWHNHRMYQIVSTRARTRRPTVDILNALVFFDHAIDGDRVIIKREKQLVRDTCMEFLKTRYIYRKLPMMTPVRTIFVKSNVSYIVSNVFDRDLFAYISDGLVTKYNVFVIFRIIVEHLHAMHSKSMFHRDLKLENILIAATDKKNKYDVRFIDFESLTIHRRRADACGTRFNVAPEVFFGDGINMYDCLLGDCFSLGVILNAMITSRGIWDRNDAYRRCDLPPDCHFLVKKLVHRDPAMRWTTSDVLTFLDSHS